MESKHGRMEENMLDNGKMENSMGMVYILIKKGKKKKGYGMMEKFNNGCKNNESISFFRNNLLYLLFNDI